VRRTDLEGFMGLFDGNSVLSLLTMKELPIGPSIMCPSAVIRFLMFSNVSTNMQYLQQMDSGFPPGHMSVTGFDLVVKSVSDPASDNG
jgi:hypothetical protein